MGEYVPRVVRVDGGEEDEVLQGEEAHAAKVRTGVGALEANVRPLLAHQRLQLDVRLQEGPQLAKQRLVVPIGRLVVDAAHLLQAGQQLPVAVHLHQTDAVGVDESNREVRN